jgi:hypothetical protein
MIPACSYYVSGGKNPLTLIPTTGVPDRQTQTSLKVTTRKIVAQTTVIACVMTITVLTKIASDEVCSQHGAKDWLHIL